MQSLSKDRDSLKSISSTLDALEKIMGGTYVQDLAEKEKHRRQSEVVANGLKGV